MDYEALRREGIHQLERLTGGQWTDFNTHDPGITILDQLCYALTDLGYRADFAIPDLLAEGGADPYASLHPPSAILTCRPVTPSDLRRLALDCPGVKNAWVEALDRDTPPLYYDPDANSLSLLSGAPAQQLQPVKIKGLYRVLVEATDDADQGRRAAVESCVTHRLQANRSLCEDFAQVTVLPPQWLAVNATVEVAPLFDAAHVLSGILGKLANVVSPIVPFATLSQMIDAGHTVDEIFDGPLLQHGFLSDEVLAAATRRVAINTSDLIHAIMDVEGVRLVSHIDVEGEPWSLQLAADLVAKLDVRRCQITLTRGGTVLNTGSSAAAFQQAATPTASGTANPLAPPPGRNRNLARYGSIMPQFPTAYGIGELGLPSSASAERKAQALQLKAYLMFFDQIMANHLAQLAHVKDLFSFEGSEKRTYFAQALDQPTLGLSQLRDTDDDGEQQTLWSSLTAQSLHGGSSADLDRERRSRFVNHLLARFAEVLDDPDTSSVFSAKKLPPTLGLKKPGLGIIPSIAPLSGATKEEFLQRYPQVSSARGTAFNYLGQADAGNQPGLAELLRLKLGLTDDETFVLVEHVLLRPQADDQQAVPLMSAPRCPDPYSLQLTFVFPPRGRFADSAFQKRVEQAVRTETPAHLIPYVSWMDDDAAFDDFQAAYTDWLAKQQAYLANKSGATLRPARDARDVLIELLGIGETYPFMDVSIDISIAGSPPPITDAGTVRITLGGVQQSVVYTVGVRKLLDGDFALDATAGADLLRIDVPDSLDVPAHAVFLHQQTALAPPADDVAADIQSLAGGKLQLTLTEQLAEDSVLFIRAHKDRPESSVVALGQPAVALLRPWAPPTNFTLAATPNPSGHCTLLSVTGGQPGVFYHFRADASGPELGRSAYFHRMDEQDPTQNRGLGQLRISTDLVIVRAAAAGTPSGDPAHQPPPAPIVDLPQPPQGNTLSVSAVKARTGVAWLTSLPIPFTSS